MAARTGTTSSRGSSTIQTSSPSSSIRRLLRTVYTSACSGIYKSENGGELYHKIQGIPSTARRTRVLMQDPVDHSMVYAGTTEGLYRTSSAGTNWTRLTGPDVIINDVYVDPKNPRHVLLATDRSGVLMSNDQAVSFAESNRGFSQRQVAALAQDVKDPNRLYAGVVNDKMYGGVFTSGDDGKSWQQQSQGLDGRDVFSLARESGRNPAGRHQPRHIRVAGWPLADRGTRRSDGREDDLRAPQGQAREDHPDRCKAGRRYRRTGPRIRSESAAPGLQRPLQVYFRAPIRARYGPVGRCWGKPII